MDKRVERPRMFAWCALLMTVAAALAPSASSAQAPYTFDGRDREEILRSVTCRRTASERLAAAQYLSRRASEDPPTLWARAMLASSPQEAARLARVCLAQRHGDDACLQVLVTAMADTGAAPSPRSASTRSICT